MAPFMSRIVRAIVLAEKELPAVARRFERRLPHSFAV